MVEGEVNGCKGRGLGELPGQGQGEGLGLGPGFATRFPAMPTPHKPLALTLALGLAAALAKALYSYFAPFLLIDAVLFLALGYVAGARARHNRAWEVAGALAAPAALLAFGIVLRLHVNVVSGEGLAWAASAVLVPAAAYAGVRLGRRRAEAADNQPAPYA